VPDLPDLPDASDASDESVTGSGPDGPAVADPDGPRVGQSNTAPAAAGPGRGKLAAIAVAVVVVLVVVGLGFVATRKSDTAGRPPKSSGRPPCARVAGTALAQVYRTPRRATHLGARQTSQARQLPPYLPAAARPYIVVTQKNQGRCRLRQPTAPRGFCLPNRGSSTTANAAVPRRCCWRPTASSRCSCRSPQRQHRLVKAADVTQTPHDFHIEVRLSQFNLKAYQGGNVILDVPIAVASNNTPTPGGLYYTTELLKPPEANSPYGTYAYGLSGFSDVYKSFNGGPGQIGIHGTNTPSSIGKASAATSRGTSTSPVLPLSVVRSLTDRPNDRRLTGPTVLVTSW
jgi:hypothetical protein